jgi:hypothetical protein
MNIFANVYIYIYMYIYIYVWLKCIQVHYDWGHLYTYSPSYGRCRRLWNYWWNVWFLRKEKYWKKTCPSVALATRHDQLDLPRSKPRSATVETRRLTVWSTQANLHLASSLYNGNGRNVISTTSKVQTYGVVVLRTLGIIEYLYLILRLQIQWNTILGKLYIFPFSGEKLKKKSALLSSLERAPSICLCCLAVGVPAYKGPGSIPGSFRFPEN